MIKYRSTFEHTVAKLLSKDWQYEPIRRDYIIKRKYTPDFVHSTEDIWIEVKGYFRVGDVAKYKAIKQAHPTIRCIFIFSNPAKKVRKNAKMTMGQWADKNGWEYMTVKDLKENKLI